MTDREWDHDTERQEYVKHTDDCIAKIGQIRGTHWAGFVMCGRQGGVSDEYTSLAEAKAWCDRKIAQYSRVER